MPPLVDITVPPEQTEGSDSTVSRWFQSVGAKINANEPLLELTTDKVTVEVAAPSSGLLHEILKNEGDKVVPGDILGRIAQGAEQSPTARAAPPNAKPEEIAVQSTTVELSPAVRRLVREHGLDPAQIPGTGRGGRISVDDVEAFLTQQRAASRGANQREPLASRRVPHTLMRKSIAEHMSKSVQTAPHVTSLFEADLSAVIAHRTRHKEEFAQRGVALTYTAYFVRATVEALRQVPEVNSRWHDDALELFEDYNIGIGTALESGGLIVPVLHQAQSLDLFQTAERLGNLTTRARSNSLNPKDVQGGTFTISNHGVSGSLWAAPIIIPQPQSAILGIGKLEQRIVVNGSGQFEARPKLYVTLTLDHRVLDGFQANAFLTHWVKAIESV